MLSDCSMSIYSCRVVPRMISTRDEPCARCPLHGSGPDIEMVVPFDSALDRRGIEEERTPGMTELIAQERGSLPLWIMLDGSRRNQCLLVIVIGLYLLCCSLCR